MCVPGDKWQVGNEIVLRMNPLVVPLMHEINVWVHYFFTPLRLVEKVWEDFITGGKDGDFVGELSKHETGDLTPGSLWDHLGYNTVADNDWTKLVVKPTAFARRAYNLTFNEYYRDQNVTDPVDLDWVNPATKDLHVRSWEKDYFTSMLPWQQRGQAPALPLNIMSNAGRAVFSEQMNRIGGGLAPGAMPTFYYGGLFLQASGPSPAGEGNRVGVYINQNTTEGITPAQNAAINNFRAFLNNNHIILDEDAITTFDVSDLRIAFQVQKFLERNARTGARYVEFLKAHFPAWPRDDRLQRPEYIGGSKTPIVISEVLQTSQTSADSPQGNLAGHGISADRTFCGSYSVQEHGIIMGIMSIMPRTMYQQGIDRVWLQESRYDFYFPEFANLSEQAVMQPELFNLPGAQKEKVIGYQGRWDEYRYKRNTVHGLFRDDAYFSSWAIARKFGSPPTLNEDLIRPNAAERLAMKRFLAVPSEPAFVITFGNKCHVTRPMPYIAEPGLIDHG